jgi:hypothetical protein
MAPETQEQQDTSNVETTDQETQDQQQQTTPEPGANGSQQPVITDSTQLPDTHPLVKTLKANKDKLSSQAQELRDANARAAKATELEEELAKRPTQEAVETLQTRFDRLSEFLEAVPGPLGRALDSRTFTKDLFETDKDIASLVKDFLKKNPSVTSQALGGGTTQQTSDKPDPNALLRAAAGKS